MEEYVIEFAKKILAIDSPTGYCKDVIEFVNEEVKKLGYQTSMNNKGNLFIHVEGKSDKTIGLCAHVDTLGLMVRSIKENGDLAFTNVGGPIIPTLDGEYCRVITRDKKVYTGTILSDYPAAHVYEESKTAIRKCENMHIRLDEIVKNKEDVKALGIENGDFIAIDPKTVYTDSGFLKSRFLDDIKNPTKSEMNSVKIGDKLHHKSFGNGRIIGKDGNMVQVKFKNTEKTLDYKLCIRNNIIEKINSYETDKYSFFHSSAVGSMCESTYANR